MPASHQQKRGKNKRHEPEKQSDPIQTEHKKNDHHSSLIQQQQHKRENQNTLIFRRASSKHQEIQKQHQMKQQLQQQQQYLLQEKSNAPSPSTSSSPTCITEECWDSRQQFLRNKKLALIKKRTSLEKRLLNFVDQENHAYQANTSKISDLGELVVDGGNNTLNNINGGNNSLNNISVDKNTVELESSGHHHFGEEAYDGDELVADYPVYDNEVNSEMQNNGNDDGSCSSRVLLYHWSGPLHHGQPKGFGTIKFVDGQVYTGNVNNGVRHQGGTNMWPDGQVYVGEWNENSRAGHGTHTWPDGRTVTGQWQGGHLNGRVVFSWPNGASYDGECKKGKKHGRGIHTWPDGKVYSGRYANGREDGFGTLTIPDLWKYRGQFVMGSRQGYGTQIWNNKTYDGEWMNNKAHGKGRIVWNNGACYTGEFSYGKYHGVGVYLWSSKKKYVGHWVNGVKEGRGVYTWPTGKKYDGYYKQGRRHGYGRMQWADGHIYCGAWKSGKRCGRGIQTNGDGSIYHCGVWKNDQPLDGLLGVELNNELETVDMDQKLKKELQEYILSKVQQPGQPPVTTVEAQGKKTGLAPELEGEGDGEDETVEHTLLTTTWKSDQDDDLPFTMPDQPSSIMVVEEEPTPEKERPPSRSRWRSRSRSRSRSRQPIRLFGDELTPINKKQNTRQDQSSLFREGHDLESAAGVSRITGISAITMESPRPEKDTTISTIRSTYKSVSSASARDPKGTFLMDSDESLSVPKRVDPPAASLVS